MFYYKNNFCPSLHAFKINLIGFFYLNGIAESEKIHYLYSREILLNTATIREVNSTEIDSHFTARETQDYAPLQRQGTNNQTSFRNFKTRNLIYLQWLSLPLLSEQR